MVQINANGKRASLIRSAVLEYFERVAGFIFSAGQIAQLLMILFLVWPEYTRSSFRGLGIEPAIPFSFACVVMLISSPFLLYSASVGLWRMREINDDWWRGFGIVVGLILFVQGLANAIIPVFLLAFSLR